MRFLALLGLGLALAISTGCKSTDTQRVESAEMSPAHSLTLAIEGMT